MGHVSMAAAKLQARNRHTDAAAASQRRPDDDAIRTKLELSKKHESFSVRGYGVAGPALLLLLLPPLLLLLLTLLLLLLLLLR